MKPLKHITLKLRGRTFPKTRVYWYDYLLLPIRILYYAAAFAIITPCVALPFLVLIVVSDIFERILHWFDSPLIRLGGAAQAFWQILTKPDEGEPK
jgi:hypothetical protein